MNAPAPSTDTSEAEKIVLAAAILKVTCEQAAVGKSVARPIDLLAHLAEPLPDNALALCAVLIRALASADFLTEKDGLKPTAFGLSVHAQGDALVQIAAKDVVGWRSVVAGMSLQLDMAKLDGERKDDEIKAYKARVVKEKALAEEVTACEADVEAAKAETSAAKERLAAANTKLAGFVRGDVQTSLTEGTQEEIDDGAVTAYEQGIKAFDPAKAEAVNPYPHDPQKGDWQRGYDKAKGDAGPLPQVFEGAEKAPIKDADELGVGIEYLDDHFLGDGQKDEMRRGTAVQVEGQTVRAFERDYLVADGTDSAPYRYLTLPLYTKDEWQQLHEGKLGRAVDGPDQTDEAKIQRQTGGEFCGRVVKFGRKKMIIGPMSDALIVEAKEEPEEADPRDEPEEVNAAEA